MKILLSNDDGYLATGIQTLFSHLKSVGHHVTMVAPHGQRSAQSHSMSFYRPIQVVKIADDIFSADGTPADCIAVALSHILKKSPPDIVISGINHGLNVGIDVNYSGTVGAATEAALIGYKAIAVSMDNVGVPNTDLEALFLKTSQIVAQILNQTDKIQWPKLEILNINVPLEAKSIAVANCGGESLYVPHIEELVSRAQDDTKVYLIGGVARNAPNDMSQDVSLVSKHCATLSFIAAKQSSTQSNKNLQKIIEHITV